MYSGSLARSFFYRMKMHESWFRKIGIQTIFWKNVKFITLIDIKLTNSIKKRNKQKSLARFLLNPV